MKKTIPLAITFLAGFYMILAFFVPHPIVANSAQEMQSWEIIIVAFTLVLGIGNLIFVHAEKIQRKRQGWFYSLTLLICLAFMMVLGLFWGIKEGTAYYWLYDNVMAPLSSAMFSLLAFFIASAAYRAFRARNKEATLLLIAAAIIMIGRVPLGSWLWQHVPLFGRQVPDPAGPGDPVGDGDPQHGRPEGHQDRGRPGRGLHGPADASGDRAFLSDHRRQLEGG